MGEFAASAPIERRTFLKSAGAVFLTGLSPMAAFAFENSDALLASAYRDPNGAFGIATMNDHGDVLSRQPLPARGHDVVWHPHGGTLVVFARRPGTFAVALSHGGKGPTKTFSAPANRHFYGHGCFSVDGKLLYATENDFENAKGKIGIYDATDAYRRIGEFGTFGTGPHDLELMSDGATILIANGGIETHPDFPRAKLNLASMKPNLTFVDANDGSLRGRFSLPETHRKLSIRHLAKSGTASAWFACQNEGELSEIKPLIGEVSLSSGELKLLELPNSVLAGLRGYVGSIACNKNNGTIAITSPRGGVAHTIDPVSSAIVETVRKPDICGVAALDSKFQLSSGEGFLGDKKHKMHWDNHLAIRSAG